MTSLVLNPIQTLHSDQIDFEYDFIKADKKWCFKVYITKGSADECHFVSINDFVSWMCICGEIDGYHEMDCNCEDGEARIYANGGYFNPITNMFYDCEDVNVYSFANLFEDGLIDSELICRYLLANTDKYEF